MPLNTNLSLPIFIKNIRSFVCLINPCKFFFKFLFWHQTISITRQLKIYFLNNSQNCAKLRWLFVLIQDGKKTVCKSHLSAAANNCSIWVLLVNIPLSFSICLYSPILTWNYKKNINAIQLIYVHQGHGEGPNWAGEGGYGHQEAEGEEPHQHSRDDKIWDECQTVNVSVL